LKSLAPIENATRRQEGKGIGVKVDSEKITAKNNTLEIDIKETGYSIGAGEVVANIAVEDLVTIRTEGEKRVLSYEILLTEDRRTIHFRRGYAIIYLTMYDQKVEGEGICWRTLFVSFIRGNDLEAGALTDFILRMLADGDQVGL
jgi:hypothetical protein